MHTKDKLAKELELINEPELAAKAREGYYDDYLSPLDTPQLQLLQDLYKTGHGAAIKFRERVKEGEFDGTKEEADAWAASPEGQAVFGKLAKGKGGG